jgi:hypothetical protein
VATAINYVMVLIVTATAAAIMVQAVSATVTAKFLAIATVLKRMSFLRAEADRWRRKQNSRSTEKGAPRRAPFDFVG